jgi:hypothetical protein
VRAAESPCIIAAGTLLYLIKRNRIGGSTRKGAFKHVALFIKDPGRSSINIKCDVTQDERWEFDISEDFPFVLELAKYSEFFSTTC